MDRRKIGEVDGWMEGQHPELGLGPLPVVLTRSLFPLFIR